MAEPPSLVPASEVGYVNPLAQHGLQWDVDERIGELQWPNSVRVYKRMDAEDGRVSSVLQAIGLPLRRTAWRVDPAGARDEVTQFVASNLGLPVVGAADPVTPARIRGRFSWSEHLQTALLMLRYGHQYFEQIYRIGDDGRAYIRKLAPRPASTIARINVAFDGGLISIEQKAPPSTGKIVYGLSPVEIPVSRLVVYRRDPDPGDWVGRSLLRPAYKHWLLKDEFMKIEAVAARRNGIGVPLYKAPPNASKADIEDGRKMASRYRGGETSGAAVPDGADLKLLGVQGNLPDIRAAIEYHDKQIALAGLAHFLNLDRGGSYALASVQADTFVQSVQTFGESVRDTAQDHVIADLVELNFGPDEVKPRLVFDEIGSRQDLTAAAFKTLIDAGLIRMDGNLEAYTRQQYGLPAPDPDEPEEAAPEFSAADVAALINAAGTLIRSGFDAQDALRAVGLDPIKHLGLLPVTVQKPPED